MQIYKKKLNLLQRANMKDQIIEKAAELFNGSGVHQISFRNIAAALGVSDGHVRYYYKTKEVLLLALFEKMNQEILLVSKPLPERNQDISMELKDNLKQAFTVMTRYSFFFTETPATFSQFTKVGRMYKDLVQSRKDLFINLFDQLTQKGYFRKEFSPSLQQQAFYSIFIISDSWLRHHYILHNEKPDQKDIKFHSDLAFSILLPYIDSR